MAAYNDLKALIGALQVSADGDSSDGDPLLRPFDLGDDRCVQIPALLLEYSDEVLGSTL
jgi:hypothetical protein